MARKSISKKTRFEVFKRDSFTCQYCGRMAPDVVLEVDHINPIANGGDDDIMNLVTSCFDCNRGKGKRKLTESDEIKKQQEQLKELNSKREQLKMMLDWRKELQAFNEEQLETFLESYEELTNYTLNETGKEKTRGWIKEFGLIETLDCLEISVNQYLDFNNKETTIRKVYDYIPKIASVRKRKVAEPLFDEKCYIRGILKNRLNYVNEKQLMDMLKGLSLEDLKIVKAKATTCSNNWTKFKDWMLEQWGCEQWE